MIIYFPSTSLSATTIVNGLGNGAKPTQAPTLRSTRTMNFVPAQTCRSRWAAARAAEKNVALRFDLSLRERPPSCPWCPTRGPR